MELCCTLAQYASDQDSVIPIPDQLTPLPISPGLRVYTQLPGHVPNRPTHSPSLGKQAFWESLGRQQGVIAEEPE
jgi:hypothetical protein